MPVSPADSNPGSSLADVDSESVCSSDILNGDEQLFNLSEDHFGDIIADVACDSDGVSHVLYQPNYRIVSNQRRVTAASCCVPACACLKRHTKRDSSTCVRIDSVCLNIDAHESAYFPMVDTAIAFTCAARAATSTPTCLRL